MAENPIIAALRGSQFPIVPLPRAPQSRGGGRTPLPPATPSNFDFSAIGRAIEANKQRQFLASEGRLGRKSAEKLATDRNKILQSQTDTTAATAAAQLAEGARTKDINTALSAINGANNIWFTMAHSYIDEAGTWLKDITNIHNLKQKVLSSIASLEQQPRVDLVKSMDSFRKVKSSQLQIQSKQLKDLEARDAADPTSGDTGGTSQGGPPLAPGASPNGPDESRQMIARAQEDLADELITQLSIAEKDMPAIRDATEFGRSPERIDQLLDAYISAIAPGKLGTDARGLTSEKAGSIIFGKSNAYIDDSSPAAAMIPDLINAMDSDTRFAGSLYYGEQTGAEGTDPNDPTQSAQLNIPGVAGGLQVFETGSAILNLMGIGSLDAATLATARDAGLEDDFEVSGKTTQFRTRFRDKLVARYDQKLAELLNQPGPGNTGTLERLIEDRRSTSEMVDIGSGLIAAGLTFGDSPQLTLALQEITEITKARDGLASLSREDLELIGTDRPLPGMTIGESQFSSPEAEQAAHLFEQSMISVSSHAVNTVASVGLVPTVRAARMKKAMVERHNSPSMQREIQKNLDSGMAQNRAIAMATASADVLETSMWIDDKGLTAQIYDMIGNNPIAFFGNEIDNPHLEGLRDELSLAGQLDPTTQSDERQAQGLAVAEVAMLRMLGDRSGDYFSHLDSLVDPESSDVAPIPASELAQRKAQFTAASVASGVRPTGLIYYGDSERERQYFKDTPLFKRRQQSAASYSEYQKRLGEHSEAQQRSMMEGLPDPIDPRPALKGLPMDPGLLSITLAGYDKVFEMQKTTANKSNALRDSMGGATPSPEPTITPTQPAQPEPVPGATDEIPLSP